MLISNAELFKVPPEITAQCLDRGIVFSVVGSSQTQSLWEVGVDQEPLTSELALQRGYLLSVQNQKTVLEIPLFSIGYTYDVRHFGQPWLLFMKKVALMTPAYRKSSWTRCLKMPSVCESKSHVFSFMNLSTVSHVFQDINLSNFYGTFQLLLRDFKSLEVQTSTSKRCLFKTQDMMGNSVHLWSFVPSQIRTNWC